MLEANIYTLSQLFEDFLIFVQFLYARLYDGTYYGIPLFVRSHFR